MSNRDDKTHQTLEEGIDKLAKEILELGLHQYGGYSKDSKNCERIAEQAILALITKEIAAARVDELERLIGTHNNDPSVNQYEVIRVTRDLLNKRIDALASPTNTTDREAV